MEDVTDWYGPDTATFGDRVAASREAAGMSQAELARRLGVRIATLRAWEDDLSEPRANRLSMMAGLLNVSMMWLINGQGEGLDPRGVDINAPVNLRDMMAELREMRAEMIASAEKIGRLEKKLRTAIQEDFHDGVA